MRFFVKKSQKDKKSGLYLSYFYTVYTYQKHGKLDTLIIPILDESRFLAWKRTQTHDGQPIATETTCSRVNEKDYVYVQWKMDEDAEPLCMLGTVINKTKEGARIHYFNGGEFYNNAGEPFHSDHPAHDTIYKVNMPGQQPAKAQQEQKKQQPAAPQAASSNNNNDNNDNNKNSNNEFAEIQKQLKEMIQKERDLATQSDER